MADEPSETTPENPTRNRLRVALRILVLAAIAAALGAVILQIDLTPNLSHVRIAVLSGAEDGAYHATVDALAARAEEERGEVRSLTSAGSIENLSRLLEDGCEADFGLVQDGLDWRDGGEAAYQELELTARLPRSEMLLMLSRDAAAFEDFADLRGLRVGVGPEGSGTAAVMARLLALPGFSGLDITPEHGAVSAQVRAVRAGQLDVATMVVFPDAPVVTRAVTQQGLQVVGFRSVRAVAAHLEGARAGVLPAGHFDVVRGLPEADVPVLTLDTLLVAGPCARRSETNAVLQLLAHELPGFVAHNREVPPPAHVTQSEAAREFFDNHGPPLIDQYLPWVVDIVPLSNVMTLIMAISVLFNVMSFLNRFRLWRLDSRRHKVEDELRALFGGSITRKEITTLDPTKVLCEPEQRRRLEEVVQRLQKLLRLCRRYATSVLVPMGQEMVYRYQENLILELIAILRRFQRRQAAADQGEDWDEL
ncbi:MAG: TAXI family TRAP transporter solute-binding subunit [Sandaracinaceae bacterium]